ncbi:hypothetical protein D9M68_271180 [compost metagenome]
MLVAIEDDQVELVDLVDEQFTRRERDQRQFVDRRTILLFLRAQNGEVHEIDRGVGFQEITPGTLTGMRLAGHKQHAQIFANAVEYVNRTVVGRGHFAWNRIHRKFEHVVAAARNLEAEGNVGARLGPFPGDFVAVEADADFRGPAGCGAVVDNPERELLLFADDAETRRVDELDAPVELIRLAGDQAMNRGVETQFAADIGHVVDLAIGHEDGAADARWRNIGERCRKCGEEVGRRRDARRIGLGLDDTRLDERYRRQPRLQALDRTIGLLGAVAILLALAAVNHDRDDRRERITQFDEDGRIGDRQGECGQGEGAQPGAAYLSPQTVADEQRRDDQKRHEEHQWKQRSKTISHRSALTAQASGGGPAHEPDRTCSCRSACTS